MLSKRIVISDTQWALMKSNCFGKTSDSGRTGGDSLFLREHFCGLPGPAPRGMIFQVTQWGELPSHRDAADRDRDKFEYNGAGATDVHTSVFP